MTCQCHSKCSRIHDKEVQFNSKASGRALAIADRIVLRISMAIPHRKQKM